jgi:hypothetical protein
MDRSTQRVSVLIVALLAIAVTAAIVGATDIVGASLLVGILLALITEQVDR